MKVPEMLSGLLVVFSLMFIDVHCTTGRPSLLKTVNSNICRGNQFMTSKSCKNEMEKLRNTYRFTLSKLQSQLAKTIDESNDFAEKMINPLCSKLSITTPLVRPEDVEKCQVSEWSEWSKPLGFGKIQRTRTIVKEGCNCPSDDELMQTVDISKYSGKLNISVDEQFQGGFLTNGSDPSLPRDILIIIDSSGSIQNADFEFMKEGVITMIDLFCGGFGPDKSNNRLAIIQFATNVTVIHKFNDAQDIPSLQGKIRDMTHYSGNTCTGDAVEVAAKEIFNKAYGMRDFTVKDTLLVTDGQSNCGEKLDIQVGTFLQPKSQVWALGIGLSTSPSAKRELESVVTRQDSKYIFSLDRFENFKEMVENIRSRSATDRCQPLTDKKKK